MLERNICFDSYSYLGGVVAVEAVVEPRNEGADCQKCNATVIKLGKQFPYYGQLIYLKLKFTSYR